MSESIKLTEEEKKIIFWQDGRETIGIDASKIDPSEGHDDIKIQKIINQMQEAIDNYNPQFKEFYDNWRYILQENKKLKEIIKKTKIIFDDGSVDDDTFFPKLEEILGEKYNV